MELPVIDLSLLRRDSHTRILLIEEIRQACQTFGIFTIINHGISETVIEEALKVNADVFDMPAEMKEELISADLLKPVRYSTVQIQSQPQLDIGRDYIKLYAHPFEDFVDFWPKNPPDYREKMERYKVEVRKLGLEILGSIMESLNLGETYMKEKFEKGLQMLVANNYPPPITDSSANITIGARPHSDHSIITILFQTSPGLQVMDKTDGSWKLVPFLNASFQVLVGDHLEVLSNGRYGSVFHRVELEESNRDRRMSIANFQSLGIDEILETANELVDEEHPKRYKGSSLRDFLKNLASGASKPFLETLQIHLENE